MFVYLTIRFDVRPVMNVCLRNNKVGGKASDECLFT